jgi:hypothetical protein
MNGEGRDITVEQHRDREEGGAGVDREMIDTRTRKINGLEQDKYQDRMNRYQNSEHTK